MVGFQSPDVWIVGRARRAGSDSSRGLACGPRGLFLFAFALIVGTAFAAFALGQYASLMYWVAIVAAVTGLIVLGQQVPASSARLNGASDEALKKRLAAVG